MARNYITQLIDDLDGTILEDGEGETVYFSVDGRDYEIDLSDANASRFLDTLAPFVKAARRRSVARTKRGNTPRPSSGGVSAIRAWARANGHIINDRGRVPAEIVAAYEAANAS